MCDKMIPEVPFKTQNLGTSLAVQWLRLHVSTDGGVGSNPGKGTKILQVTHCSQKKANSNNNKKSKSNLKKKQLKIFDPKFTGATSYTPSQQLPLPGLFFLPEVLGNLRPCSDDPPALRPQ